MFDRVVLRRAENGSLVTAGQIAEALLYYQGVHLVLDPGTLMGLAQQGGLARLKALLELPQLSAVFCEETIGTITSKHIVVVPDDLDLRTKFEEIHRDLSWRTPAAGQYEW